MRRRILLGQWTNGSLLYLAMLCLAPAWAADEDKLPKHDSTTWKATIKPYVEQHCIRCHSDKKAKAGVNFSGFEGDMLASNSAEVWREAIQLIEAGEMPPKDEPQPTRKQIDTVLDWARKEMARVRDIRINTRSSNLTLRRLTNLEYKRVVQDLLGTDVDIPDEVGFIEDTSIDGFHNTSAALDLSAMHADQYLRAAEHLVHRILSVPKEKPELRHWTIYINPKAKGKLAKQVPVNNHQGIDFKKKKLKQGRIPLRRASKRDKDGSNDLFRAVDTKLELRQGGQPYSLVEHTPDGPIEWDGYSDLRVHGMTSRAAGKENGGSWLGWRMFGYAEGWYETKLTVYGFGDKRMEEKRGSPYLRVLAHPQLHKLGRFHIPIGERRTLEFKTFYRKMDQMVAKTGARYMGQEFWLPANVTTNPKFKPAGLSPEEAKRYPKEGLPYGLAMESIEIKGPIIDSWPPPMVANVFPKRQPQENDESYVRRLLGDLASRAWRRPVTEAETEALVAKYREDRANSKTVRKACRRALVSIFSSPYFFCNQRRQPDMSGGNKRIGSHDLANRLSLFIWRSMPDTKLRQAADDGSILEDSVLIAHARRMLADERRMQTFWEDLPRRWFGLDQIHQIAVDNKLNPGFKPVEPAMIQETELVFRDILMQNRSVFELIDSNWTYVNTYLAKHYKLEAHVTDEGIHSSTMRRVPLTPKDNRGGVLSHASIHTVTSNGIRTSPIHRGVFILKQILATNPPPPAPNVSALEEVVPPRENATIRELLELHRDLPECRSCHEKIDPLGFALEGYNAIGRWRTHEKKLIDDKLVDTHPVDLAAAMPDGTPINGLAGLKKYIIKNGDRFRRCIIEKLLTYAVDRQTTFVDEPEIDKLIASMKQSDDKLQELIIAIVRSDTFRNY